VVNEQKHANVARAGDDQFLPSRGLNKLVRRPFFNLGYRVLGGTRLNRGGHARGATLTRCSPDGNSSNRVLARRRNTTIRANVRLVIEPVPPGHLRVSIPRRLATRFRRVPFWPPSQWMIDCGTYSIRRRVAVTHTHTHGQTNGSTVTRFP